MVGAYETRAMTISLCLSSALKTCKLSYSLSHVVGDLCLWRCRQSVPCYYAWAMVVLGVLATRAMTISLCLSFSLKTCKLSYSLSHAVYDCVRAGVAYRLRLLLLLLLFRL